MNYLCSYHPICSRPLGRRAVEEYGLPPFIDASCRREPDLESPFPSISALCRTTKFAPRLWPSDRVVYITTKGRHGELEARHWRLVAVLQVVERFENHDAAAAWYRVQEVSPPANCMVEGNPPVPFERTGGPNPVRKFGDPSDPERVVRLWDASYRVRSRSCGVFLACRPLFLDLHTPPSITDFEAAGIFEKGRMPVTQNPPRISDEEFAKLWLKTPGPYPAPWDARHSG